jgi:hypothetical protein
MIGDDDIWEFIAEVLRALRSKELKMAQPMECDGCRLEIRLLPNGYHVDSQGTYSHCNNMPTEELTPGMQFRFPAGTWTVVKQYPHYPTGRSHVYEAAVEIRNEAGQVESVPTAFLAKWMRKV